MVAPWSPTTYCRGSVVVVQTCSQRSDVRDAGVADVGITVGYEDNRRSRFGSAIVDDVVPGEFQTAVQARSTVRGQRIDSCCYDTLGSSEWFDQLRRIGEGDQSGLDGVDSEIPGQEKMVHRLGERR